MRHLVESFGDEKHLTHREKDVLFALTQGHTTFKELAKNLDVSPNTINNHLKSVFRKTKTNSKSEVLSLFLSYVVQELGQVKQGVRRPKIYIVDDEQDFCELLARDLKERGLEVYFQSDPTVAVEEVFDFYPDLVLCDVRMPKVNGLDFLRTIRKKSRYYPLVLFVSGHSDFNMDELLALGGADLVKKPVSADFLFKKIMEHLAGPDYLQRGKKRVDSSLPGVLGEIRCEVVNIGFGGVFISFDDNHMKSGEFNEGDKIFLTFPLPDDRVVEREKSIQTLSEVMWKRSQPRQSKKSGLGLRFLEINEEDQRSLQDFVRTHNIISFIPSGD